MGIFETKSGREKLDGNRRAFATYTLEDHGGAPAHTFVLRPPGGGNVQSTTLIFTGGPGVHEYIAILGDLCPQAGGNGVVSNIGYGVGWFARPTSHDHLCQKFLRQVYVPELARAALEDHQRQERADAVNETLSEDWRKAASSAATELEAALADEDSFATHEALYETWEEVFGNTDVENTGMGYDARDAALLVAIQEAFARLYHAMLEQANGSPAAKHEVAGE